MYDVQRNIAESLASELDCQAPDSLAAVTAASDVVITVVTDDSSMRDVFGESGDSLLTDAAGTTFINCATITPQVHVTSKPWPKRPERTAWKPVWPAASPRLATARST